MRKAFFFDQSRCIGCNACTIACKDWYNVNPGPVRYRKQWIEESKNENSAPFFSFVMSCNHCEDPACIKACGQKAIYKRADGIVLVDRTKCREMRSCITACPFAEPDIADDRQETDKNSNWNTDHPMQKCTMCADLQDKGELPICVRSCAAHAIEVGDFDELKRKHPDAEELDFTKHRYAWINVAENGNDPKTGPSFLIKTRKPFQIIK